MDEKKIKALSFIGAPGFAGVAWAMTVITPTAPLWLAYLVGAVSLTLAAISVCMGVRTIFWKADTKKTKEFIRIIESGSKLINPPPDIQNDLGRYKEFTKDWISAAEEFVRETMNDEETLMLMTIQPIFVGDNENAQLCSLAISSRVGKLRLIAARYINGQNIR